MIWVTILELPTGFIADKYGRKTSLLVAAITISLATIVYGSIPNIWIFLLGELLFAFAISCFSGADDAWLVDTLKMHQKQHLQTKIIGVAKSSSFIGMILASLLGGAIAQFVSINATMYLSAIPALMMVALLWRLPEPKLDTQLNENIRWQLAFSKILDLFRNKKTRILSLNIILVGIATYFVTWLYQPVLIQLGVTITWFGIIYSALLLMESVVSHRFEWFEQKIGINLYLNLTAVATTIGFIGLAIKPGLLSLGLFLLTAGAFGLTRKYFGISQLHTLIDSQYRSSTISAFSLLLRLSTAVSAIIVGWLFTQSQQLTFSLLAVLPILAISLFQPKKMGGEQSSPPTG